MTSTTNHDGANLGSHGHTTDECNQGVMFDVNGELVPREKAVVSVFDSGFILGDGIWEGLRLKDGHLSFLERHLDRVYAGARAIDLEIGLNRDELRARLWRVIEANGMTDGVHVRLMITRGEKATPYQDPRVVISPATIVILAEYKSAGPEAFTKGLSLFTVHVRRGRPDVQDPKLNTHSKHNCIQACIQATKAGADEALMLDPQGFVATCNSTHFFIVRRGEVWTSTGDYCLDGITRGAVIEAAERAGITVRQRNFSLSDVYSADEAFVTGTYAGLTSVGSVDGRELDGPFPGPMVARLTDPYQALAKES